MRTASIIILLCVAASNMVYALDEPPPLPLSPLPGEVLPNNCDSQPGAVVWTFSWTAVPGAYVYAYNIDSPQGPFYAGNPEEPFTTLEINWRINTVDLNNGQWRAGAWVTGQGFTGWTPWQPFSVESCCGTYSGYAGEAYVIVGDIEPSDDYEGDPTQQLQHSQRAVDLAVQRLQDYGYTVSPVIGQAYPPQPATASQLQAVCENPDVRAVALFSHGLVRELVPQHGEHYWMANGEVVSDEEIAQWRSNGIPLTDISLYMCNAGQDNDILEDWNVAPNARVIMAPSRTNPIIWNSVEERKQCPDKKSGKKSNVISKSRYIDLGYTYLHAKGFGGESPEEIYEFQSGFAIKDIYPTGQIDIIDPNVGIRFLCSYVSEQDSLIIWANKYASTPVDTVPPSYICASAYFFGSKGPEIEGIIELYYNEEELQSQGMIDESDIGLWLYDENIDMHVPLVGSELDSINNVITILTPSFETSLLLLSLPEPVTNVWDVSVDSYNTYAYPNPFNPTTTISYELSTEQVVSLCIYDMKGKLVKTIIKRHDVEAGSHNTTWNGRDNNGRSVPSGTYCYRLTTRDFVETRMITLVR